MALCSSYLMEKPACCPCPEPCHQGGTTGTHTAQRETGRRNTRESGPRGLPPTAPAPRALTEAASSLFRMRTVSRAVQAPSFASRAFLFGGLRDSLPGSEPGGSRYTRGAPPREKVSAQTSPPPTAGRERGARRKACLMWAPRVLPFPRVARAE